MMKTSIKFALSAVAAASMLVVAGGAAQAAKEVATPGVQNQIAKQVYGVKDTGKPVRGGGGGGTGISYHGGPVMVSGITIYPIWYGNISASTKTVLTGFMSHVGGSGYFNINTTYTNAAGTRVQNLVTLSGTSYSDTGYSLGKSLSDANIQTLVSNGLANGLPNDPNGFYLVLTAPDVTESSGFITKYCGWHTYANLGGNAIKYSFVGDPTNGMGSCAYQTSSPSGNAPADAMISVIAHELEEATTDPQLNAWYDNTGAENGDKCAWKFGTTSTATNGSLYNVTINGVQYLIQQNWVNAGSGGCLLTY